MKNPFEPDCQTPPTEVLEESSFFDKLHSPECDLFKPRVLQINGEKTAAIRACDCKNRRVREIVDI